MKKPLLNLALIALIAGSLAAFSNIASVRAASINTVIRGQSQQTVYWYANDGKRYVFPNAATYFTWYTSFNNVQNISDAELFTIPLGGNVTYRPGAKLIKIATDPKVYAVARGGILRHVTSESLAIQLYGSAWASKVDDVQDTYFSNYTVGAPIYSTSDYNVSNEYNGVFNPGDSLRNMSQNNNNNYFNNNNNIQTGSLTLTADRTSITSGQAIYLTGIYSGTLPSGGRLEIKDVRNNNIVKTCYDTSVCTITVYPIVDSSQNSAQYYIVAKNYSGTHIATQYGPVISIDNYIQNNVLSMTSSRTNITSGQAVDLNAFIGDGYPGNLPNGGRIEIKEVRTNNIVKTCYAATCQITVYPYQSGYSSTQYYAVSYNASGSLLLTQYGPTIYFDGIINTSGSSQIGTFTMNTDRTNITSGQAVYLTAAYNDTFPSNGRLEIKEVLTGYNVKTCYAATCAVTVYPYQSGYSSTRYYAVLSDASGSQIFTQYGETIYFNGIR